MTGKNTRKVRLNDMSVTDIKNLDLPEDVKSKVLKRAIAKAKVDFPEDLALWKEKITWEETR